MALTPKPDTVCVVSLLAYCDKFACLTTIFIHRSKLFTHRLQESILMMVNWRWCRNLFLSARRYGCEKFRLAAAQCILSVTLLGRQWPVVNYDERL